MAMSPRYKVHDKSGTYVSSCKNMGAALFLLDGFYPGGHLRDGSWNRKLYQHDGTRGHDLHAMLLECHAKQEAWADANAKKYGYDRS